MTGTTRAVLRRGARSLVDDAVDRIRSRAFAVLLLHVLPSLPFFASALWWCVDLDLRGAMPEELGIGLVALLIPKIMGWSALAAWSATAARGRETSAGSAWLAVARRLPEALLAATTTLLFVLTVPFTFGLALIPALASCVGLAAGVGPTRSGGLTLARDALDACVRDAGRAASMALLLLLAWGFLVVNLLALPFLVIQLGGGGLGLDLNLWGAAFRPDRAAAWGFAGLFALLLVEAVVVVACAEWQFDREAEREGARFASFADELEARDAQRPGGGRADGIRTA